MERHKLSVSVSTWNVGASTAAAFSKDIDQWLHLAGTGIDVHAIALQEVVDINSPATYFEWHLKELTASVTRQDGLDDEASAPDPVCSWDHSLMERMKRTNQVLVARKRLVGMMLYVFVAEEHAASCAGARVAALGTGLLGAGNKGAVAASLRLYGSLVCIVCAHLASGHKGPEPRHRDVAAIQAGLMFPPPAGAAAAAPLSIGEHDFVIWAGDLNYRISMKDEEVHSLIRQADLGTLAAADELTTGQAQGRAFAGYVEGALAFPPTYKFDKGTAVYDTSAKRRAPAWTDRVLWRRGEHIRGVSYGSHVSLRDSDHRPVSAILELSVGADASRAQAAGQDGAAASTCDCLVRCIRACFGVFGAAAGGEARSAGYRELQ
jgi:endonuclease/exonuclease/phosphatase family metal-dependent hydrolase